MNKKKIILFGALLIISLASVFFIAVKSRKKTEPLAPGALPRPKINSYYKDSFNLTFSKEDFDLPISLPVLITFKPPQIDAVKAKEIALNMGYNFEPRIVNDTLDGISYVFDDNKSVLYIRSKTSKIEFHNYLDPSSVTRKDIDTEEFQKTAVNFLLKFGILKEDEIQFSFARYFKRPTPGSELVYTKNKGEAFFYQINFSQKFNSYYIVDNTKNSPTTITLLADGSIYKAEISIPGETRNSPETYPLKSFQEIKDRSDEYVLVSINESDSYLEGLDKTDISDVVIETIEPAYYRESSKSETMQPIYLLGGSARITGNPDRVNVLVYTPALKQ